jgi:hypothetical protein
MKGIWLFTYIPHRPTVEPQQRQRCLRQQQCSHTAPFSSYWGKTWNLFHFIVSYMKGIWLLYTYIPASANPRASNTSAAVANKSVIQRHVPDIAAEHGTNSIS